MRHIGPADPAAGQRHNIVQSKFCRRANTNLILVFYSTTCLQTNWHHHGRELLPLLFQNVQTGPIIIKRFSIGNLAIR